MRAHADRWIVVLLAGAAGCGWVDRRQDAEYGALSALINEITTEEGFGGSPELRAENRPVELIVIQEEVGEEGRESPPEVSSYVTDGLPSLDSATIVDFESGPRRPVFTREFTGIGEYILVPARAIFDDRGWSGFYEEYPGAAGVFAFSHVGLSADRSQALIHATHLRDGLWGHADFYLLERRDQRWQVVEHVRMSDI